MEKTLKISTQACIVLPILIHDIFWPATFSNSGQTVDI